MNKRTQVVMVPAFAKHPVSEAGFCDVYDVLCLGACTSRSCCRAWQQCMHMCMCGQRSLHLCAPIHQTVTAEHLEKPDTAEWVTCIHVEGQCLADVSRGEQAGPGGSGLQFADFIVAWQGREMGWPHCGHEQGPVVGLQS